MPFYIGFIIVRLIITGTGVTFVRQAWDETTLDWRVTGGEAARLV